MAWVFEGPEQHKSSICLKWWCMRWIEIMKTVDNENCYICIYDVKTLHKDVSNSPQHISGFRSLNVKEMTIPTTNGRQKTFMKTILPDYDTK